MYIIKALINSFNRKKLSVLLVWLQFTLIFIIVFVLVNSFIKIFHNEYEKRNNIIADFNKCCQLVINSTGDTKQNNKNAKDFLLEVKKLNEVGVVGNYFYYNTPLFSLKENKAFISALNKALDEKEKIDKKEFPKKLMKTIEQAYYMRKKNLNTEILSVDFGLFKSLISNEFLKSIKIDNNIFSSHDLMPVILGYGYKDAFNIGDTFISSDGIFKCKVVGILDKNSKWLNTRGSGLSSKIVNIDNSLIVLTNSPGTYIDYRFGGYVLFNNYLISKKPFNNNLKLKISQIAEKYGFTVGVYTFNQYFDLIREDNLENSYLRLFSILFLSTIAIFGLSSLIVYDININKREIGIRIACGAKEKHIIGIFCIEILLITFMAFLASCIMANSKGIMGLLHINMEDLNVWVYIYTFLISVITCILSCIYPIRSILKLKPSELTGGY